MAQSEYLEAKESLQGTESGFIKMPSYALKPASAFIRECYPLLFLDILDLASHGISIIHISGNPGIGKSCFLWYVLARLLNDPRQQVKAIIVQLVSQDSDRTLVFTPHGTCEEIDSPQKSEYFNKEGTWLLTDQKYVGQIATRGITVLFASPKVSNWDEARRSNIEAFRQLYMPPWSIEELKVIFFHRRQRTPRLIRQFWTRFYIFGPVARWYGMISLQAAFAELCIALECVINLGVLDARLFKGGVDNGLHSHKIFCSWPSADFSQVAHISFLSEYVELSFALAMCRGTMKTWMTDFTTLAGDVLLRTAAGHLFERYAHYRLAAGGEFPSIDNPNVKLVLQPRAVRFFDGNKLQLGPGKLHELYLRPNSSSFPMIDAVCPPDVMFQVRTVNFEHLSNRSFFARSRKPMKKSVYDSICEQLRVYKQNSGASSCVQGVTAEGPWAVLVKMRGDNSTHPVVLKLVEEEDVPDDVPAVAVRKRRRCTSGEQQTPTSTTRGEQKTKSTSAVEPHMTIVLGEMEDRSVDYRVEFQKIYDHVVARMVGEDDPGHLRLYDYKTEEIDTFIRLHMRNGLAARQYNEHNELDEDTVEFGVWIEAVRTCCDYVFTTTVTFQCTTGTFKEEDRELTCFIHDWIEEEIDNDFPVQLTLTPGQQTVTAGFEIVASLESDTLATVTVHSRVRECKYFRRSTKFFDCLDAMQVS